MLISNIGDGKGADNLESGTHDHTIEYQTANELLDMMSRNTGFDPSDGDSLTTQDLILLYKNIDLGTKLLNEANAIKQHKPNQHVETVVYNDDQESDSDFSESLSTEDVTTFIKANQERLDIFNNQGSLEHLLCHKLGGLKIQTPNLTVPYNTQFMFQDPFIKAQLEAMNITTNGEVNSLLPTSLLDYICCKRLEDNYNFYMDNIIKYVQHTIEQLKRISNGDFLTEQAKEKWKEVNCQKNEKNTTKILANSTSIPLHVECKNKNNLTLDDIVHSEVDVRSLSKILEKKIVLEIPKLMCGSYKLFSKNLDDNFIISCKRERKKNEDDVTESRVDVVVQLQRLQTGLVMSNINSIMILQTAPSLTNLNRPAVLPITYKAEDVQEQNVVSEDFEESPYQSSNSIKEQSDEQESDEQDGVPTVDDHTRQVTEDIDSSQNNSKNIENEESMNSDGNDDYSEFEASHYPLNEEYFECYDFSSNMYSSDTSGTKDYVTSQETEISTTAFNIVDPNDDLRSTMKRLNMQTTLAEESNEDIVSQNTSKKRSPVRIRIKSPYENKSFLLEEKKRKKLLEIREKREKKKMALNETCKISKHKFFKNNVLPQASNSVTKLSITNKSFYNSIYGHNTNKDNVINRNKLRKCDKKDITVDIPVEQLQDEYESPNVTPDRNTKKFINRSYYLDEAETAMMYTDLKNDNNNANLATSESNISKGFKADLDLLSQLMKSSNSDFSNNNFSTIPEKQLNLDITDSRGSNSRCSVHSNTSVTRTPLNTPVAKALETETAPPSSLECRKSIDKLYDLMNKSGQPSTTNFLQRHYTSSTKLNVNKKYENAGDLTQGSDSGTSLKHQLTPSTRSSFSFEKHVENPKIKSKKPEVNSVVPKVIINSKLKTEAVKLKEGKKVTYSPKSKGISDNPLKTITQLLHEFDTVQKNRHKTAPAPQIPEHRRPKRHDGPSVENKNVNSFTSTRLDSLKRRSRLDQHLKETEVKTLSPRDKKTKLTSTPKTQQVGTEDKYVERVPRKKVEIVDDVNDYRADLLRGPSKNSRLYSLAQPKRIYVQAHSEEYLNKYGKNLMAHRLQKLAASKPLSPVERKVSSASSRKVRPGTEPQKGPTKPPSSPVQSLDKSTIKPRSYSCSPGRKPTYKNKPSSPGTKTSRAKLPNMEAYLKNNYPKALKRFMPINELSLAGNKSRVPVLPRDIDVESLTSSPNSDEANELGNRLHSMVNSLVIKSSPLSVLCESQETKETYDHQCDNLNQNYANESDYKIDVIGDKTIETAVQNVNGKRSEVMTDDNEIKDNDFQIQTLNSKSELKKLENALYSQLSGTFQKRLRIKNLTLTPKQSLQKGFLLQSGDAGSLLVKSLTKFKINECDRESLHNLNVITEKHLKWDYIQIPTQVATVGYAFSSVNIKNEGRSGNLLKINDDTDKPLSIISSSNKSDKVIQCFKGVAQETPLEPNCNRFQNNGQVLDYDIGISGETENAENKNLLINNSDGFTKPLKMSCEIKEPESMNLENNTKESSIQKQNVAEVCSGTCEAAGCTSSLDVLVGLLNEIQKITSENQVESNSNLQTAKNNTATTEEHKNDHVSMISITSLDKIRKLKSDSSICSFYLSNEDSRVGGLSPDRKINSYIDKSIQPNVDKEVNVNIGKQLVSTFTDMSPKLFRSIPMTFNSSMSKSLGVFSEPSNQSMYSFTDYHTLYFNNVFDNKSIAKIIIELPKKEDENRKHKTSKNTIVGTDNGKIVAKRASKRKVSQCIENFDFDPLLKMKRDILVTMYSILVLTVFAALSFPELLAIEG